jgi:hypothetical protein
LWRKKAPNFNSNSNSEPDGISKPVDWRGGGGFDFYRFQD